MDLLATVLALGDFKKSGFQSSLSLSLVRESKSACGGEPATGVTETVAVPGTKPFASVSTVTVNGRNNAAGADLPLAPVLVPAGPLLTWLAAGLISSTRPFPGAVSDSCATPRMVVLAEIFVPCTDTVALATGKPSFMLAPGIQRTTPGLLGNEKAMVSCTVTLIGAAVAFLGVGAFLAAFFFAGDAMLPQRLLKNICRRASTSRGATPIMRTCRAAPPEPVMQRRISRLTTYRYWRACPALPAVLESRWRSLEGRKILSA